MFQPQDHYFKKAKAKGYSARSVYKLQEIDVKYGLIRRGARVLDLGCAPGSWLQYCASKVGPEGRVAGVDLKLPGVEFGSQVKLIRGDVREADIIKRLQELSSAFDVVLSDMAPATSGIRLADTQRSLELAEVALGIAENMLKSGGAFLVKVLEGEGFRAYAARIKAAFRRYRIIRPQATRKSSSEIYILGQEKH